ncbi:MAG: hypothetical protein IPM29_13245 [Planctomycetes bacterium]|nr:hypothetical protein [Planctomycetota bacterium]
MRSRVALALIAWLAVPLASQTPPSLAEVRALLGRLDAAFESCDLPAYEACFAPVHVDRHTAHLDRIARVLRTGVRLQRHSEALDGWELGPHRIALVRTTTRSRARADRPALVEHALVAARSLAAGVRAELLVEVDERFLGALTAASALQPKSLLRCHACNYRIDGGTDWLTVPNCKERVGCLESLSFYALDTDVAVDLTVHLARGTAMPEPTALLGELARDVLHAPALDLQVAPWVPPMYVEAPDCPQQLRGAQSVVEDGDGDRRTELAIAVYGRLGYLFVVRGRTAAVLARREQIDALLASFTLLDPDLDAAELEARILTERLGGSIDGSRYVNERFRLTLTGVPGWDPTLSAAHDAFDVVWRCPQHFGLVRAQAFTPPRGLPAWTQADAEPMLQRALHGDGVQVLEDGGWTDDTAGSGFAWRRALRIQRGEPARLPADLRLYLDGDLLLVVEGQPYDERARAEIQLALDSVRRD